MLCIEQVNSSASFIAQLLASNGSNPSNKYVLPKRTNFGFSDWFNLEFLRLHVLYIFSQSEG